MKRALYYIFIIFIFTVFSYTTQASDKININIQKQKKSSIENRIEGVVDVLFGWTEIVTTPAKGAKKYGLLGFFGGVVISPLKMTIKIVDGFGKIASGSNRKKKSIEKIQTDIEKELEEFLKEDEDLVENKILSLE